MPDKKALGILFDTYWTSKGWKSAPTTPPDDLAYATAAGIMFPPRDFEHDEVIKEIIGLREQISPRRAADAFLASLSTRRLDLRSALGSYAVGRHLPRHKYAASKTFTNMCGVCGDSAKVRKKEDVNVLNFERFKWGGVRHLQNEYIAFDLARFLETEPVRPTDQDRDLLRAILDPARHADSKLRPGKLEQAINVFPSSKEERRTLLQILGFAGVLQPRQRPGFFSAYVTRDELAESNDDWNYPICWWRGSDGINEEAVAFWWER